MKKFITKAAMVAAFAVVAGYGVYTNQTKGQTMSDIMLENVEALARYEYDPPYRIVPCSHAPWNECATSSNTQYEKCGFLSYC